MKSHKKINPKLQFLYGQNEFLNPKLRTLLCNSLIQLHFDNACISCHPLVSKKNKKNTDYSKQMYPFLLKIYLKASYRSKKNKK